MKLISEENAFDRNIYIYSILILSVITLPLSFIFSLFWLLLYVLAIPVRTAVQEGDIIKRNTWMNKKRKYTIHYNNKGYYATFRKSFYNCYVKDISEYKYLTKDTEEELMDYILNETEKVIKEKKVSKSKKIGIFKS